MDYTVFTLGILGLFGVLVHNLVKMNKLNRESDGKLNLGQYIAVERFSILISVCVIVVLLIARWEVKQLEIVGNWLGIMFFTAGYTAQSLLSGYTRRAEKMIKKAFDEEQQQKP